MGPETRWVSLKQIYGARSARQSLPAFWHEWRKGNTIPTPRGDVVYLDLRHLGEKSCSNACRLSASWPKPMSALTR